MRLSLSNYQLGTLKYIHTHDVHVEHLRMLSMTTVLSLVKHGYLIRVGTKILLTDKGQEDLQTYLVSKPNFRQNEHLEISKTVQRLLDLRRLRIIKRSNAA